MKKLFILTGILVFFLSNLTFAETLSLNPKDFLKHLNEIAMPDECKNLPAEVETFQVPVEHGNASSKMMNILFSHTNPESDMAFIILGGGPGEAMFGLLPFVNEYLIKLFPADYDIITMDHRGAGCSQVSTDKEIVDFKYLKMDQAIEDLHDYLLTLNKKEIYLYGGSYGSFLALGFARKYPEMVDALFLDSVFGSADGVIESNNVAFAYLSKIYFPNNIDEFAKFYEVSPQTLYWIFANRAMEWDYAVSEQLKLIKSMTPDSYNKIRASIRDPFNTLNPYYSERLYYGLACQEIWPASYSVNTQYDYYYDLSEICPGLLAQTNLQNIPFNYLDNKNFKIPTLVLSGLNDYSTPYISAQKVFKSIATAKHVVVKNAGHAIFQEFGFLAKLVTYFVENNGDFSSEQLESLSKELSPGRTFEIVGH